MSFVDLILYIGLAVGIYMTVGFVVSLIVKRNDIVDIMWGLGFLLISVLVASIVQFPSARTLLVLVLITIWSVRLSIHIALRMKKNEDFRYKAWRDEWMKKGKLYFGIRSYAQIFLLQGFLMMIIAAPTYITASFSPLPDHLSVWALLGFLVWLVGFFFEAVGDAQLHHFITDPKNKGKLMTTGLWNYTRHPNYFGEVTQWWGIFLIILPLEFSFIGLASPLMITFLILYVSGIPMLEKRFEGNSEFEQYKKRTSAFFPLPPRTNV